MQQAIIGNSYYSAQLLSISFEWIDIETQLLDISRSSRQALDLDMSFALRQASRPTLDKMCDGPITHLRNNCIT